jgi:hypothetical protein
MKEDETIARRLVADEFQKQLDVAKQHPNVEFKYWQPAHGELPDASGAQSTFVNIVVGVRFDLTKQAAKNAGIGFRQAVEKYPNAQFHLNLMGYDEDPRELWDIVEAARYIRQWAKFAGLHSPEDVKVPLWFCGMGLLAACGCWGDEMRDWAIKMHREKYGPPVTEQ